MKKLTKKELAKKLIQIDESKNRYKYRVNKDHPIRTALNKLRVGDAIIINKSEYTGKVKLSEAISSSWFQTSTKKFKAMYINTDSTYLIIRIK